MNDDNNNCIVEKPENEIIRLEQENEKLRQEIKFLANQLLDRDNLIEHLKMTFELVHDRIKGVRG